MSHRIFLLLFSVFPFAFASGQLLFHTLRPGDGLSTRETRCVFRDGEGYVWVGTTNGLNRFDGAHFKVWNKLSQAYPNDLGEITTTIIEHGTNRIYFGTDRGVGLLDKRVNRIEEVAIDGPHRGKKPFIHKLEHDGQGRLWMGCDRGLMVEQDGRFVPVSRLYPFAKELDTLAYLHGAFLYDKGRNCFWMGTTTGSYCLDLTGKQLYSALHHPSGNPFFTRDLIVSIALDGAGNLWFSNATKASLLHFDFNRRTLETITHINNNPTWTLGGGCNSLFFDKKGRLWISTWLYSAFIRYPDGRTEEIPYNREFPYSIGYGFFHDAFEDRYGNVWLATINGVSKLEDGFVERIVRAPTYKYYLSTGYANINAVQIEGNHTWWLGKMEGLVRHDLQTGRFDRFILSAEDLRANEIFDLKWINGALWCVTNQGIRIFDPKTTKFRPLEILTSVGGQGGSVQWFLQDREGWVWLGMWGRGIYRHHPVRGETIRYDKGVPGMTAGFAVESSTQGFLSSDGNIWIATANDGIFFFDKQQQAFVKPASPHLQALRVTSMAEDTGRNIWLASPNGILKCSATGKVLDSISRKNGLPLNSFFDLTFDAAGRLWTISRESLLCILPGQKEITRVHIPANYSFNDHWNSLWRQDSLLFASMLDNVVVMNTRKYQKLPEQALPLISSFSLFGKEESVPDNGITLKHWQNFFSFDFASPFHQETGSLQYAYKLEGFDKDWVYSGRRLTASYTNVPDGDYVFRVKTTDQNGQWMATAASVELVIKPPFWKSWWFITLSAVVAAFAIASLYRIYQKRDRKRQVAATIDYFANSMYGNNSITEICWDIARNCISQLKLEDCVVYLLDEKRNVYIQKAAYGPKNPKDHEIINPIEIQPGEGIVGTAALNGKPVVVKDTSRDSRYIVDDISRLSELAVPIIHEGKAIGVIDSEHPQKNFFTEEHVKALSTIAAISASKIAEAKAEDLARQSEIQLLQIKKLLAESQLMALRAQMNPHFVFNCLNSIQECIVTEKYGEASLYLNKFSKLFRSVLNNSSKLMVSLAEEIEVLELYLSLEHMRFEQSFRFEIRVDDDLETDEIMIPSMLLQPFVENALWHGLMHKPGDRQLTICFEKMSEEMYRCVIDDNGIGRKKALELKEQQSKTKRHVSKGMSICRDRIELLQKQGHHAQLRIDDKYEGGMPTGTRVSMELSSYLT